MPRISEFYGIIVEMYWDDHNPPHFHARYGDDRAEVEIRTFGLLCGHLPPKAHALVIEWATLHQGDLLARWESARQHQPLAKIAPLE